MGTRCESYQLLEIKKGIRVCVFVTSRAESTCDDIHTISVRLLFSSSITTFSSMARILAASAASTVSLASDAGDTMLPIELEATPAGQGQRLRHHH